MRTAVRPRLELAALLLAAGLCCADAQTRERIPTDADWTNAITVAVTMVNYEFIPDRLSFRRGVPYRLLLGPYATRIVVRPHEAKDMYFIATRAGSYELICADHDLTARISVE